MKMYTNSDQTAKLIELGFEKPNSAISYSYPVQSEEQRAYEASLGLEPYLATVDQIEFEYAYSIGELIDMLPRKILNYYDISILSAPQYWEILYGMIGDGDMWSVEYEIYSAELIDALYDMVVKLKEEGVI